MKNRKERIKIGIVGAGCRGIDCFGLYMKDRPDVSIEALCDSNSERMRIQSLKIGGTQRLYSSVGLMLEKEKLDAVVVATPDFKHRENVVSALEHGVNVLVDKPLATNVKDCAAIIDAARKSGKIVMMGFNMRHNPVLVKLKEIVDSGKLGKIFLIENREYYNGGRTYMARWNRKYEFCGGLWVHKGSHDFDVFNWLLGFPKPFKISATAGINVFKPENLPFKLEADVPAGPACSVCAYAKVCPDVKIYPEPEWSSTAVKEDAYMKDLCIYMSDKDVHDNGIAIVEYENGARASHMECFVCSFDDRKYTVIGDLGIAELSLEKREITIHPRWSAEVEVIDLPEKKGSHGGADPSLIEDFIRTVKGEIPLTSTIEQGLVSTLIGQAAEISSRESRCVFADEFELGAVQK